MKSVLDHLREASVYTYRLDADPPGMKIYQRLGFIEEFTSLRFRREPWPYAGNVAAEPLEAPGIKDIAAFDLPRFGDNRERLLGMLLSGADQAWITRVRGLVTGFAMVLPTNQGVHLGPWVANDVDTAGTLLDAALVRCASQVVTCGMPKTNPEGQRLLRSRGFSLTAPSIRMVRVGQGMPAKELHLRNCQRGNRLVFCFSCSSPIFPRAPFPFTR